jgi:hypothetical protein
MTGQLQREKAAYYFSIIDEDNNKYIEADDFEMRAERLVEARGVTDPDAKAEIHDQVMNWWHHLCSVADVDNDERVTQREWQRYWQGLQTAVENSNEAVLDELERAARATFRSIKVDDGDQVTQAEYAEWLAAWGVDDAEAPFDRLDRDDTGGLTEEDLVQAVREFYLSNDPDAPGNVLYGKLPE